MSETSTISHGLIWCSNCGMQHMPGVNCQPQLTTLDLYRRGYADGYAAALREFASRGR